MFTNSYRMTCAFPSVLIFLNQQYSKEKNVTPTEHSLLAKLKEERQKFELQW